MDSFCPAAGSIFFKILEGAFLDIVSPISSWHDTCVSRRE